MTRRNATYSSSCGLHFSMSNRIAKCRMMSNSTFRNATTLCRAIWLAPSLQARWSDHAVNTLFCSDFLLRSDGRSEHRHVKMHEASAEAPCRGVVCGGRKR